MFGCPILFPDEPVRHACNPGGDCPVLANLLTHLPEAPPAEPLEPEWLGGIVSQEVLGLFSTHGPQATTPIQGRHVDIGEPRSQFANCFELLEITVLPGLQRLEHHGNCHTITERILYRERASMRQCWGNPHGVPQLHHLGGCTKSGRHGCRFSPPHRVKIDATDAAEQESILRLLKERIPAGEVPEDT